MEGKCKPGIAIFFFAGKESVVCRHENRGAARCPAACDAFALAGRLDDRRPGSIFCAASR